MPPNLEVEEKQSTTPKLKSVAWICFTPFSFNADNWGKKSTPTPLN